MSTAIFLRLLRDEDKAKALAEAIAMLREGRKLSSVVYPVSPVSFRQVPGSPFAYWVWCTPLSRQFETEIKIKFCAYTLGGFPGWWKPNALCYPPPYTAAGVW